MWKVVSGLRADQLEVLNSLRTILKASDQTSLLGPSRFFKCGFGGRMRHRRRTNGEAHAFENLARMDRRIDCGKNSQATNFSSITTSMPMFEDT